jgi:CDP-diacylglycerol--glycerol-3-phosphate 3-phosphatidyltransferase
VALVPKPIENGFLKAMDPLASGLVRLGIKPNVITTISLLLLILSGVAYALDHLRTGAILLLSSGIFDLLDGKVARGAHQETKFGAFYDSTMDRLGEAALFTGLGIYFMNAPGQRLPFLGLAMCFAALSCSFLVSYTRARAEGLGLDCKVGIARRAERFIVLGFPTAIWGPGNQGWMLLVILTFLALVGAITTVQRIAHVYRLTEADRLTALKGS